MDETFGSTPPWTEDLLSAYLDGECTPAERAAVEAQLTTSAVLRGVLDEVSATRDALRALPLRDAPPAFWARLLASDDEISERAVDAPVVALAPRRRDRTSVRWLVAAGGAAAAAVIAAMVLVPQPKHVTPPVAAFADAHAVRSSLQSDAVSSLVPVALQAGFRR